MVFDLLTPSQGPRGWGKNALLHAPLMRKTQTLNTVGFKVGRSKPPPVLTSGFNRLKPPRSICQKKVNTGQYESEWSIENSKGRFCGKLRYFYRFYVLSIEKKYCFVPAKGTF